MRLRFIGRKATHFFSASRFATQNLGRKATQNAPTILSRYFRSLITHSLVVSSRTLIECIPNLSEDLAAWVSYDKPTPLA